MPPETSTGGATSGISANSSPERICQTPSGKFETAYPEARIAALREIFPLPGPPT